MPERKRIRLEGYDYSQNGAYFITICTYEKQNTLAIIEVGQGFYPCRLTQMGEIVQEEIQNISLRFPSVRMEQYVIMPNHIHLLFAIEKQEEGADMPTVGSIVGAMKSVSTKRANAMAGIAGRKIWQFRFYDRIMRDRKEFEKVWTYIETNPLQWEKDCFFDGGQWKGEWL